jgi:hypothetical protein
MSKPSFCVKWTVDDLTRSLLSRRYPETWQAGGKPVFYRPNLRSIPQGKYKSGDPVVVREHIRALDYAYNDLAIASCE